MLWENCAFFVAIYRNTNYIKVVFCNNTFAVMFAVKLYGINFDKWHNANRNANLISKGGGERHVSQYWQKNEPNCLKWHQQLCLLLQFIRETGNTTRIRFGRDCSRLHTRWVILCGIATALQMVFIPFISMIGSEGEKCFAFAIIVR